MQTALPETLAKVRAASLGEISRHFTMSKEALAVADFSAPPARALAALVGAGCLGDAISLLAFGLPKREAVWWSSLCARRTLPEAPVPAEQRVLACAEAWVYQPTEDNRRAAMAAAEIAGFDIPSSWCAVAAFWSGGSMAPPGAPVVPPGDELTGRAVSGAVQLAVVRGNPLHATDRQREFIDWAIDIANGGRGQAVAS